jgi:hypothetical protein
MPKKKQATHRWLVVVLSFPKLSRGHTPKRSLLLSFDLNESNTPDAITANATKDKIFIGDFMVFES